MLTGATGALGAHLLDLFRTRDDISQIICLVRAKDPVASKERVSKSLLQRKKRPLDDPDTKVVCLVSKLREAHLGLSKKMYDDIAERA